MKTMPIIGIFFICLLFLCGEAVDGWDQGKLNIDDFSRCGNLLIAIKDVTIDKSGDLVVKFVVFNAVDRLTDLGLSGPMFCDSRGKWFVATSRNFINPDTMTECWQIGPKMGALGVYIVKDVIDWENPRLPLYFVAHGAENKLFKVKLPNPRQEVDKQVGKDSIRQAEEMRQQEAVARRMLPGQAYAEDLGNGVELELVWIPLGEFMMGSHNSEANRRSDEGPRHRVKLTQGYWMGKHEVTQAQWQAIMGSNPSYFKDGKNGAPSDSRNHPVETVSWNDCQEFITKLSRKTGAKFRLPTEAEWEYACRAGTETAFHYVRILAQSARES